MFVEGRALRPPGRDVDAAGRQHQAPSRRARLSRGTGVLALTAARSTAYEARGITFPFDEAYYADLARVRPLDEVARKPIFAGAALDTHRAKRDDVGFDQFLTKLYETAVVLDAMRATSTLRRFERSLDIGSGPALHARILKMLRLVAENEAIDIYDGSLRCSDGRLHRHARRLQALHAGYRARKVVPSALRARIPKLARIERRFPYGIEQFGYRPDEAPYRAWFAGGKTLARYRVGDVFEVDGRYDLVTSFMALDYFEFDRIAAKVSSLLAPNGLFAFIVSHWWYPVNNTLLYGRFPYLLQQLGTAEAIEYFQREHPGIAMDGVRERLGFSDQLRPAIADFERLAHRHGMTPRMVIRLHPDPIRNPRSVHGPLAIDVRAPWSLERVLENARRVNPSVAMSDLMTAHVMLLAEKR